MNSFTGAWHTTFGLMDLVQEGRRVHGAYHVNEEDCPIKGKVAGQQLTFTYQEGDVNGEGWFALERGGEAFAGQYRTEEDEEWHDWEGTRVGFAGLWETTFGRLRLIEEGELARGFYEPGSTIQGALAGHELTFKYEEPHAGGRGSFTLAEDGMSFAGEWQPEGSGQWSPWTGQRVVPKPELTWLVVIEAPWQRHLVEREYSFGGMLGEFFARLSWVEVRHRFFANEQSLQQYCREVMYLAEPVVVLLATHALPDGITVNGRTIAIPPLLEFLRHVPDLQLLHFSACLLMKDPALRSLLQLFSDQAALPISGYSTAVNWGASAVLEFTYLELILSHGYAPAKAAQEVLRMLPFAGDKGRAADVFPPAGFRILIPRE